MKEREQMEKFRAQNKSMPCMGIIITTIFVQQQKNRNQVGAHQWKMVEYTMVCPYSGTLCCHCQKYFRSKLSAMEGFPLSVHVCVCAKSFPLYPTLCNPMDYARFLCPLDFPGKTMPFSRGSPLPRDRTHVSYIFCIGRRVLYHQSHLGSPVSVLR